MNCLRIKKICIGKRYVMNYQQFQNELNKKIDTITVTTNEKINESYDASINKILDTMLYMEKQAQLKKLTNTEINVSINIGLITVGITKKIE